MPVNHEWRWEALDNQLSRFLAGFENADNRRLLSQTVRVLSHQVRQGDSCLVLDEFAGVAPADGERFPPADEWREKLSGLESIGRDDAITPLILDGDRLYFQRYWQYETRLAQALVILARQQPEGPASDWLEARLQATHLVDAQKQAVRLSFGTGLSIISGGPGTGKTTTVSTLIKLLKQWRPELDIALAAPTGKAAARMQEALRNAKANAADNAISEFSQAMTLHRLLGYWPRSVNFRHHAGNPLHADVVIVDEASMVDLALMAKLVDAVRPGTRLILLGDKDQLASVEAGAVFASICDCDDGNPLRDNLVLLKETHRFTAHHGIGRSLAAIRDGDVDTAMDIFTSSEFDDVALLDPASDQWRDLIQNRILERLENQDLQALQRFQILCALREGPVGAEGLNRNVERMLAGRGLILRDKVWYTGRPVMIQRNHYGLGLFNGDMGLAVQRSRDDHQVCFAAEDGGQRCLSALRLPQHETAWAMTVHKSQGSEFDEVMLVLPAQMSPVLTRELIYTALSRARRQVYIVASEAVLKESIRSQAKRRSGLQKKIADAEAT